MQYRIVSNLAGFRIKVKKWGLWWWVREHHPTYSVLLQFHNLGAARSYVELMRNKRLEKMKSKSLFHTVEEGQI